MSQLITTLGGPTAVARMLGIKAPSVIGWNGRIPADRCPAIERATNGRVPCEELRPDVRWQRVPDPAWPHPEGRPCLDVAGPTPVETASADPAPPIVEALHAA
jgi:hypothetical protein